MNYIARVIGLCALLLSMAPSFAEYQGPVKDLPTSHWASGAVQEVVDYGIMEGDGNGYFKGYKNLSRYEMAATINRLIEFYNQEFVADREDLSSLASIMEQFQGELRQLEGRVAQLNGELDVARKACGTQIARMSNDLDVAKGDIHGLQNEGFIYDDILKGTFHDVKYVFNGFQRDTARGDEPIFSDKEDVEEEVEAVIKGSSDAESYEYKGSDDFWSRAVELETAEPEL